MASFNVSILFETPPMRQLKPRIRMFAGPNGSGKSTIKDYLLPRHIGAYLNADELEKVLNQTQILDLDTYHESLDSFKWCIRTLFTQIAHQ